MSDLRIILPIFRCAVISKGSNVFCKKEICARIRKCFSVFYILFECQFFSHSSTTSTFCL
jgi:hypothetical protein